MADGEDRLVVLVEVADKGLHARVDADVFRTAAAGAVDGVILFRPDLGERLVDDVVVAEFFGVGLVAFKVVDCRGDLLPCLLAGTDGVHGMPDHQQHLIRHHHFIIFHIVSDEH